MERLVEELDKRRCIFNYWEILVIFLALSPGYIVDAARVHGVGNAVYGAETAWNESRRMIRGFVKYILEKARQKGPEKGESEAQFAYRLNKDREFIFRMMNDMQFQRVRPLEDPMGYRQLMTDVGDRRVWHIYGMTHPVSVPMQATHEAVRLGVIRTVGKLLDECPEMNRAVLPSRRLDAQVYQRESAHIVTPLDFKPDDLSVVVIDPLESDLRKHIRHQFRELAAARRHWLAFLGNDLLRQWLLHSFIHSSGGAWVSDIGWGQQQWALPIFVDGAGIPISIVINPTKQVGVRKTVELGIALDHRAHDAKQGSKVHEYMQTYLYNHVEQFTVQEV